MAPWLAMLHACGAHAPDTDVRWMRLSPCELARHLPGLGHLLYLPAAHAGRVGSVPVRRLLVAASPLAAVLAGDRLCLASTVTPDGPREWLTVVDGLGRARAQLHLLPDTDYLAWDALLAAASPCPAPAGARWAMFRADAAYRLRFVLRPVAFFRLLHGVTASPACALSEGLARRIARNEGVPLASS